MVRNFRKGGETGMEAQNSIQGNNSVVFKKAIKSSMLRSGKRTYFFDVFTASNNRKYLKITESTLTEEGQPSKRNTFILFPDAAVDFQARLSELVGTLIA